MVKKNEKSPILTGHHVPNSPLSPPLPSPQIHGRSPSPSHHYHHHHPKREGERIRLSAASPLPELRGVVPCYDLGGEPLFFGSAIMDGCVHPCKVGDHLIAKSLVPYGGKELQYHGKYELLLYDPDTMELVSTTENKIPEGKRPLVGGHEEDGQKLYHVIATIDGVQVPGKVGEHLACAGIPFGGAEHAAYEYQILCWR